MTSDELKKKIKKRLIDAINENKNNKAFDIMVGIINYATAKKTCLPIKTNVMGSEYIEFDNVFFYVNDKFDSKKIEDYDTIILGYKNIEFVNNK